MNDLIGKIVVIKRNGADGPQFPLRTNECLFGRKPECDIRIQLPNVSLEHAVVRVDEERKVKLVNLSSCNQTLVNGKPVSQVEVQHLDVFTISDRSFRFEFPSPVQKKTKEKSPKTHRRCSSTSGSTQQENRTPKMPTPKGSPRTPPTAGSLKENIHRLRRYSMPFQEEEEALASPAANKTPFSTISVNCEPQEQNYGSAELISEKTKSVKEERKSQRRSKRVSFGPVLSPEQFDKELPPATPLRRGATPRRSTNSIDHSIIPLHSSAKKRRSVIASPHTESIIEEDCGLDALMNETPKTQVDSLTSQQLGTPTGRRQSSSQLDKMIPGDTDKENIAQTIVTPKNSSKFPQMAVSVAVEGQFSSNQATPKSATPKGSRSSSSRIEQKKDQGPHESTRRSSGRLAAKSPSLLEVKSVEKQSKVTVSSGPCVEDNLEETMLDSDEYTSDEDEEQGKMAVSKGKSNRLATPLRKEIEEGVKLQKTMKKMVTPLKTEIANGIKLRQTKKRLATPLQNKIIDGTSLRQTKMKMATPLKKEIADGVKLQATKKKMATPLRKEIAEGVRLRQTKKRLATPLKKEITEGISLRQTKQKIATPLKKEITEGITLRETKKKLQTPIRKAIEDGVHLKATKKKLATPLRKAIQAKPQLRQSKKIMSSLLQNEIKQGPKLRKTKQTMPLEIQIEIIKGKQLRPTKKSLPTPLKKAISDGVTLRKTMKSLPTPVKEEIKEGVQLNKTKKSLPTPVRRQLEEGVALKQTVKSSKRKRSDVGVQGNEPKRSRLSTSKEESEAVRRALKTPLRKAIVAGTRLRATRHRMATPLRNQIHSKHVLRAVRRKSAVSKVPRKPTYAEIVKRSKKRVSQGSTKFGKAVKVFTKAIPPAKIDITAPTKSEIPTTQDKRNSIGFARKNTPQTKSTRKISSRGTSTCTETDEENQKKWMRSLARATKGVKTRFTPEEHLEGLSQMFATPPAVQINSNRSSKQKKSDNWLSSLAKATNGARKRGVPVEDFEGVSEMFATPPSRSLRSTDKDETDAASPNEQELHMTESLEPSKTPSLRSSRNNTEVFQMVTPIQSSCTPSLRSGKKAASKTPITPQVTLSKVEEVLKPKKTPSLRNSEEDAITVHVVTPVQPSRTPSLRSAKIRSRVLSSECSDPDLEFVQPLVPSKTPSMRSSAQVKAVLQKNVENPSVNRKSLGLQGLTRMLKSPKQNNAVDNVDDFFVPNLFASPKPDPKRYSRKSEGLQGVPRLLKTPKAKKEVAEDSPKLNGIKEMMQTEKTFASPNLVGLRILMKTPETHVKDVHAEDLFISELFVAPQDDLPQPSAILATQNRKDKKPSTVIDLTSPETEATTAEGAKKNDSEASPRTTRGKRKGESIEPAPKRGRRTRGTVKQEKESVPETHTKSKAAEKKSTTKSKKIKAAAVQSTPKPFVFKRTQLEPIVEVLSPLPSFDDPEATNEGRKTTSVADTQSQSKAPLRSSRRGTRAKAETSVEESSNEEVAEKNLAMKSKKNKPCDAQQDAMEEKRTTRRSKIKETQLSDVAPPVKTRATRSRKGEVEPTVEPSVTNQTTRRSRRAANTIEESVQVQGETKLITQNTDPKENQEKTAEIVPEVRSTRSSRKSERDSNNVEKDVLTRRTRGKNSKKVEVQESGKESKPKETEAADEPRSTRQTRASTKEKASLEEDTTSLQEKKQVPPDTSAKKSRPKRELKGKTAIEPRQTRSTRSVKPVENEVEPSEQSVRSTRGTKRNRQDADTVVPEPKRTRASVQTRSVNTRQTRSRSQK